MNEFYTYEYVHKRIAIDYTNWEEKRSTRIILPLSIYWGSTEWHKEFQWLLYAFDYSKDDLRHFALSSIHNWERPT